MKSQEAYVADAGARCPHCDSHDIAGGPVTVEAGKAWQEISCNHCGGAWNDQYQLVGFVDIDD